VKPRVVILGGGFGGLYAARTLRKAAVDLTVIDRRNFHLFQPLLYQMATGSLSPGEITSPLRAILSRQKNTRVLLGEAVGVDAASKRLMLADGPIPYDILIVATGARNSYFGHESWPEFAPGLKSIEDATAIRRKILYAFERAERECFEEKRRGWLTFVIVGGGPTGVELAGALAEIANDTLRHDFRCIQPQNSHILLLEGSPHLIPSYPEDLSKEAEKSLTHLGVNVRCGVRVTAIDAGGVTLNTGEHIASRTILWAAGVAPSEFGKALERGAGATLTKNGQVQVTEELTIPGHPEIFVVGDLAYLEQDGHALPGVAPVAMQQGEYAARAIESRLKGVTPKPFRYHDKGSLAVIGRARAVADLGRIKLHGFVAWVLWVFVHLMYIVQFSNRVIVFIRWGIQYITFNRGARLITGAEAAERDAGTRAEADQHESINSAA
jgi:NADH dehydrogenase